MNKTFVRNLTIAFCVLCLYGCLPARMLNSPKGEQKSGIGSQTYMELNNRRQVYG